MQTQATQKVASKTQSNGIVYTLLLIAIAFFAVGALNTQQHVQAGTYQIIK